MERVKRNPLQWLSVLALAVAMVALAVPAAAQTDVTTSRISGTIRDAEGGVLPGATVEARSQETGLTIRAVSDTGGGYRLLNLPTGIYTVTVTMPGFASATVSDFRLVLGSAPTLDFNLQLERFAEEVVVTGERPLVEVTNTASSTTLLAEQLETLPLDGRNFTSLVYLTPETRRESQRGYISISGQRGINTNVTVDGTDFNNAFFGGSTGDAEGRAPLTLSKEAVKEFSVITNGASAEFGRSAGGFVNVITKSGTNAFSGSAFYYFQPQDLVADFPDGRTPPDQEKKQFGFSLGGPIAKDRLFFFLSYDEQAQDETIPIDPRVLDADIFAKFPILASPDNYVRTRDGRVLFGRFDWFANPEHRFMARVNYADYDGQNGTSSSPTRTASYNGLEGMTHRSYVASYSGILRDNVLNDLNFQYLSEDTPREDKGLDLPDIQIRTLGNYGQVSFLPIYSTFERKSVSNTVTVMLDQHVAKFGGEYNDTSIDQIFKGNWRGVFIFANKADFMAGKWNEYRQFGGLGGLTADEAGRSAFGQKELAFYAQDQWFLSPKVTLSAGLRWERLDNPNFPILNPNDQNPDGSFRLTGRIPDEDNQFSPRVGATWSPWQKTVFRATAGRYWSRTPALLWAQTNTSNGYRGTQYNIFVTDMVNGPTDPLAPTWGAGWRPEGTERIDFTLVQAPPRPGVFTVDPNFRNPYTDRITIEWEQEVLPNTGLTLGATWAESKQLERLTDINLQYDCEDGSAGLTCTPRLGPNGMPRYSSVKPYPYYGRISTYTSDSRSEYWGLTALLQRRFTERFFGFLSATYSHDKDNDSNERNFAGLFTEDKRNPDSNWGYSDRDQRWKLAANATWNSPWWGLVFSGLYRYATGQPYTGFSNIDYNNDGDRATDRPTVDGVHFKRNSFRQPGSGELDLRLAKKFGLGGGDLSVIVECFNCTDQERYTVTNTVWGGGQTPLATFGQKSYTGTPRTIQLALRYDF